jgi:sporulation protein YlmC with PRC-barrel domain
MRCNHILPLALAVGTLGGAAGAQQQAPEALSDAEVIALSEWRYDDLYSGGISADDFIDEMVVYDPTGEEIGIVEDILIGPDGRVIAIVAEVGGLWDIGDTHVSVPYDQVEMAADQSGIVVPVTEGTVDDYGNWGDAATLTGVENVDSEIAAGIDDVPLPRAWRVSELIGDTARLSGGVGTAPYGYVNDIILRDGQVAAVVVQPDRAFGTGYRAYPYYGYGTGWDAGAPYYDMPYTREDVGEMEEFEYDRLGS